MKNGNNNKKKPKYTESVSKIQMKKKNTHTYLKIKCYRLREDSHSEHFLYKLIMNIFSIHTTLFIAKLELFDSYDSNKLQFFFLLQKHID